MTQEKVWINVQVEPEDAAAVDVMTQEDGYDNRSAWMRRLIRQEAKRRNLTRPTDQAQAAETNTK